MKLRGQAVAADPDNAQLQAELALSHNAAASVLLATGRAAEALASYETVRSVRRSLVASNPEKAELKRNLAVSHFNIGLTLASIGRPAEALADYEKAREICACWSMPNRRSPSFRATWPMPTTPSAIRWAA